MRMLYFAWVREKLGFGDEEVSPPAEVADIAGLIDWLAARDAAHAEAFAERGRLRAAIDGVFTSFDAAIAGAQEVAIFPPVTGG